MPKRNTLDIAVVLVSRFVKNKSMIMRRNILLAALFLFSLPVLFFAQTDKLSVSPIEKTPAEHLKSLHSGKLIVRIPTYSAQIKHLSEKVNTSEKNADYYQKQLDKFKKEAAEIKESVISGFTSHYEFSDVLFIMDTSIHAFLEDYNSRHLYNTQGQQPQKLNKEDVYFCIKGNTSQYDRGNKEAWLIMDHEMKRLPYGFPYYVGERNAVQSVFTFFGSIFNQSFERSMEVIAARFNSNFHKRI